jgi:hypothetical protein
VLRPYIAFRNMLVRHGEGLLAHQAKHKLEDDPLSAACSFFFKIRAGTRRTWRSLGSVVSIVPRREAGRRRNHSIPSFSKPSRLVLGYAAFCSIDTIGYFTEVKQPRREAHHLGGWGVEYLCSHPEEAGGKLTH